MLLAILLLTAVMSNNLFNEKRETKHSIDLKLSNKDTLFISLGLDV